MELINRLGPSLLDISSVLVSEISRRGNGKKEANQGLQVALKSVNATLPKTWGLNRNWSNFIKAKQF